MLYKLNILGVTIIPAIARFLVKIPTLVSWGAEDNLIPVKHAHPFSENTKDVKVVIIPEAGHIPHEEKSHRVKQSQAL